MKNMDLFPFLVAALEASFKASEVILRVYEGEIDVERKADNSPLTLADKDAHRVIMDSLKDAVFRGAEDIGFLSEEGRDIPYHERAQWGYFWLVDPLDGTKEFIKRNGEFTVNIALIEGSRPVLGVIFVPVKDVCYFGGEGIGSYKGGGDAMKRFLDAKRGHPDFGTLEKLDLNGKKGRAGMLPGQLIVAGSRSHKNERLLNFVDLARNRFDEVEFISAGSSLKFCFVAEGLADIYPRHGPTMEWDTAAGQAIVENAGGRVLKIDMKTPLTYNKEDLHNPWFVVDDGRDRGLY
ncbi:MAG TPA: 3'(2'),5'-bisphosphate nucleotidase [Nitrospirae bacterium]|nr:3'(2'),5'-bisphosphate nucleotidase [Nitrospirota bacterium]